MPDRLPPLTALRAFEAAARHMSFQDAAAELNVTPAALSFQIKSLEEHFGAPLFRRLNRAVELTEAGRTLAPGTTDGFEALTAAWRAAKRSQASDVLTVTAGPAFTSRWLAPRIYAFAQANPEIELRVSASLNVMDLQRDDVDVAIRFGQYVDGNNFSQPLLDDWYTPAMRPDMADRYPTAKDLIHAPLIHNTSDDFLKPRCDWPAWFRVAGIGHAPQIASEFSQPDHALEAALAGAGVVLLRRSFGMRDLQEGRLVAPYRLAIATDASFRFLCALGREETPKIRAFLDWITAEIADTASYCEDMEIVPVTEVS